MQTENLPVEAETEQDINADNKMRYSNDRHALKKAKSNSEIVNSANQGDYQSKSEDLLEWHESCPSSHAQVKPRESNENCKSAEPAKSFGNSIEILESSKLISGHRAKDPELLEAEKRILEDINRLHKILDNIIEVLPLLKGCAVRIPESPKKYETFLRKRSRSISTQTLPEFECQLATENNNTLNLVPNALQTTNEIHENTDHKIGHAWFFILTIICISAIIICNFSLPC